MGVWHKTQSRNGSKKCSKSTLNQKSRTALFKHSIEFCDRSEPKLEKGQIQFAGEKKGEDMKAISSVRPY